MKSRGKYGVVARQGEQCDYIPHHGKLGCEELMSEKFACRGYKKTNAFILLTCIWVFMLTACEATSTARDSVGPTIAEITTSNQSFSIDCPPTSITVTANITDTSGIKNATLWYRVGSDQPYTSRTMDASNHSYSATVKGIELPAGPYGALEFYITTEDMAGNSSKSSVDNSIQFLPCVSN